MIRILKYGEVPNSELFAHDNIAGSVEPLVKDIIGTVREKGDAALFDYAKKFDNADLDSLEVSAEEIEDAFNSVDSEFIEIIKEAADNIKLFHQKQLRENFVTSTAEGALIGQKYTPIEKVGLYVPGGLAAYPSTVLMDAIPAKIAGCKEIFMVSPPTYKGANCALRTCGSDSKEKDAFGGHGEDSKDNCGLEARTEKQQSDVSSASTAKGTINPVILVAAKIAGVDRIFKTGGAQAIAALAYGTETIPAVDKIAGPGNAFVAEAKKQVFGKVSIDMIAGPSEILIVADSACNARNVAADMLSQAEHDRMACAVLVTDCADFAQKVSEELERQIPLLPRAEIARSSIDNNGKIIVSDNLRVAIDIANEIAPEHLELCVDNPFDYLENVKNAGSVFLGKNTPEALGDYFAGPNHTLPTGGRARFSSPLSVDDFIKKTQFIYYSEGALRKVADKVAYFAEKEGLQAHARSVQVRFCNE